MSVSEVGGAKAEGLGGRGGSPSPLAPPTSLTVYSCSQFIVVVVDCCSSSRFLVFCLFIFFSL